MISVVIPMFNSKKTIAECINSVVNQTREDLIGEIIVIDDGSADGSAELVECRYSSYKKLRVIRKRNEGVSSARNMGIKAAKYDWIALLDSDDVWLLHKIELQWMQIQNRPDIRFIGGNRNNENVRWGKRISNELYELDLKYILIKNWPHTSTALIRADVFREIGLFNRNMRYAEDGDMWNRIACKYPLYYIPKSMEIAGENKVQFGECGLSADLKQMHKGNIRNISVLKKQGMISFPFYFFLKIYNDIKYVRRIFITRKEKLKKKYEKYIGIL